ncbi:hypothetical protein DL98DRAFT_591668 [Cadophora sp. DSE1049]|nr:hypothetical protein DL98DRAFT_591668 [Cadophora sp. DSE1049]
MADEKSKTCSTEIEICISPAENEKQKEDVNNTPPSSASDKKAEDIKVTEFLLRDDEKRDSTLLSPTSDVTSSPTTPSPLKSEFSRNSIDEEKAQTTTSPSSPLLTPKELKNAQRQRLIDLLQRITALALSIIILGVMTKAYVTYRANQNVTAGGVSIYPTFMQLWPTYMMLVAGAVTVALNACVVVWRVRGTMKDLEREEVYNKVWDYVLHGITFSIWLASSTSFRITKDWGPAADPNVLWGYVCSPTAKQINAEFPEVVKFYAECQVQTVSFWMSVSAVIVEGFAVATKIFVRQ